MSAAITENITEARLKQIAPYQWKKGKSPNPSGRPKQHFAFVEYLRDWLQGKEGDETRLEQCLQNLKENKPEILMAYCYGKPVETVKLEGGADLMDELALKVARLFALQQSQPKVIDVGEVNTQEITIPEKNG